MAKKPVEIAQSTTLAKTIQVAGFLLGVCGAIFPFIFRNWSGSPVVFIVGVGLGAVVWLAGRILAWWQSG